MKNTADVTGGKPIAVLLQSISGVSANNPLSILLFCPGHHTRRRSLYRTSLLRIKENVIK
jgi:hypothetical protein